MLPHYLAKVSTGYYFFGTQCNNQDTCFLLLTLAADNHLTDIAVQN